MNEEFVGRSAETAHVVDVLNSHRAIVLYGPSGIGKTRILESVRSSIEARQPDVQVTWISLYRSDWPTFLSQMRSRIPGVPSIADRSEIEDAIIDWLDGSSDVLVLDNLEMAMVEDCNSFLAKFRENSSSGAVLISCQEDVAARVDTSTARLRVHGMSEPNDIRDLMGAAADSLSDTELIDLSAIVGGNPMFLQFIAWRTPQDVGDLFETAQRLASGDEATDPLADLVSASRLPVVFFLALGVHRDGHVSTELLANLWDHYSSRGAESFIREIEGLAERRFLLPAGANRFRLHERVHVALPKLLRKRLGEDRLTSVHHYFAEYYRRVLLSRPSAASFRNFIHHGTQARSGELLYRGLVTDGLVEKVSQQASALHVISEVQAALPLVREWCSDLDYGFLLVGIARLHNDLSQHRRALEQASVAEKIMSDISDSAALMELRRQIYYVRGVGYSNTGQAVRCRESYASVVFNSYGDEDEVACLCLGYLAHDLKYSDLASANELGGLAVDWARHFGWTSALSKNLCSWAEGLSLAGRHFDSATAFEEARELLQSSPDRRTQGRMLINGGFAACLSGRDGHDEIATGTAICDAIGDRRRAAQGAVYQGVAMARLYGDVAGAIDHIQRGANGLMEIGDGRYFSLALCWLLQLNGESADRETWSVDSLATYKSYAHEHPEFLVYENFWKRNLSAVL